VKYTFRPYQTESDYWQIREFLRQVFICNNHRERGWHVVRLDYARWHTCLNCAKVGLEEVATVPAHRQRGLGRAVMTEGLRRLQRMGATTAFVGGLTPAANALYRSVMGPDYELYESWVKEW
jgi:predicted acetyltransferase